jgi:hypothetical protein
LKGQEDTDFYSWLKTLVRKADFSTLIGSQAAPVQAKSRAVKEKSDGRSRGGGGSREGNKGIKKKFFV